jgi:benzylsuccinate CoA-transferase BbsE subunit
LSIKRKNIMAKTTTPQDTALGDIRVLDLTGPMGGYSTKLLADLGADVILVEPPEGHESRRLGPFFHDEADPEKSLHFFQFNANKRSVTIDIRKSDGQEIFKKLIATADMLFETFPPGYLDSLGLGYSTLSEINPRLILVSITGYGQTGPYKDFKSCDLTGLAMSGVLYSCGYPEDPPTALGCSQAYHMVSTNAAIGGLMALCHRDSTGEGQWVDLSMQGAVLRMSEFGAHAYWISKAIRTRSGVEVYRGIRDMYACKDGYAFCSALGGSGAPEMLEWMESEGMAADLRDEKYRDALRLIMQGIPMGKGSQQNASMGVDDMAIQLQKDEELREARQHIEKVWEEFLLAHTREELFVGAQQRGVRLMVENKADDLLRDASLTEREFFTEIYHPELDARLTYFGPPYRLYETPARISRRPPLLGEHNAEILEKELGTAKNRTMSRKTSGKTK